MPKTIIEKISRLYSGVCKASRNVIRFDKAKKDLNWAPTTDLDEIIDIMYNNVMKIIN